MIRKYAVVIVVGLLLIGLWIMISFSNARILQGSRENNAYLRTMVCIASVSPTRRTPEYVKECYVRAEAVHNNHIDRYGDADH